MNRTTNYHVEKVSTGGEGWVNTYPEGTHSTEQWNSGGSHGRPEEVYIDFRLLPLLPRPHARDLLEVAVNCQYGHVVFQGKGGDKGI